MKTDSIFYSFFRGEISSFVFFNSIISRYLADIDFNTLRFHLLCLLLGPSNDRLTRKIYL